jgi:large subunit ribosomal protein L15
MPLQRRVPKRGFKNPFKVSYDVVNVGDLESLEETSITPEVLNDRRLASRNRPVKVLADGNITRKIQLSVHAISAAARGKIEAAGGTVELLES